MGLAAEAIGDGTRNTAVGSGSKANFANSAAFGANATATRTNQMVFGVAAGPGAAGNTYTMGGITSSTSKAAQGAPTSLVTSNATGDLAAYTFSEIGLATTADLSGFATKGDLSGLQSQINRLGRRDSELAEGIATAVALAQPMMMPGQHFAMRAGWGNFDGSDAIGLSAAGVLANNMLRPGSGTLILDGGVGFGTDEGIVVGRAGATFGW